MKLKLPDALMRAVDEPLLLAGSAWDGLAEMLALAARWDRLTIWHCGHASAFLGSDFMKWLRQFIFVVFPV